MSRPAWLFLGIWLLCLAPVLAQEKPPEKPWTGNLADGRVLTKADLDQILQEHELWMGSFKQKGKQANLSGANLREADLSGAILWHADLSGANLSFTNLSKAELPFTNLRDAGLLGATLSEAKLNAADLSGAELSLANLSGAILNEANLSGADLRGAKLNGADLEDTNLSGAILSESNLTGSMFEPKPGTLQDVSKLLYLRELDTLRFDGTASFGLMELREIFKKAGMRDDERQVTYALNHNRRVNAWEENRKKDLFTREIARLENIFQLVFFEWTCDWGMSPGRPLKILFAGLLVFALPYLLALRSRNPKIGIWAILPPDRLVDWELGDRPIKLTFGLPSPPFPEKRYRFRGILWRAWRGLRLAFYFSLLSAFNIGWRELNVGIWITRLQKREYNLRATDWVRMIAGIQALMSVYLLALWALTYFGRPFD